MRFRLYSLSLRSPQVVLGVALILALLSYGSARRLQIVDDFLSLLPRETQSVKALEQLKSQFGGFGYLSIVIEGQPLDAVRAFADEFSARIEKLPSVLYVDYRRPVDYFQERLWLYIDPEDLGEMENRLDRALELQTRGLSSTFSSLMDFADAADNPDIEFKDIFSKYSQKISWKDDFLVLQVKSADNPQNMDASRMLLQKIREIEGDLRQSGFSPAVTVRYTGNFQQMVEQADHLRGEMFWVSLAVTVLLLAILYAYFRSLEAAYLIGLPLFLGILWTGGLVAIFLGHLNIITGFAAAILAGLGSDYGIYLLTRYENERSRGADFMTACRRAFENTGRATFASMVTTLGAFVALIGSDFRLFVEFGVVGAVGILMNYLAMMLVLPALLSLSPRRHQAARFLRLRVRSVRLLSLDRGPAVVLLTLILCGVGLGSVREQSRISYQENLLENKNLPSYRLSHRVESQQGMSMNPTVLMVSGANDEETVTRSLQDTLDQKAGPLVFKKVLGLSSFVPANQAGIKRRLVRLREKFSGLNNPRRAGMIESLDASIRAPEIVRANLPPEIRRLFVSPFQPDSYAVYLYPAFGRGTSEKLGEYHSGLLDMLREKGIRAAVADGTFVSDDTIRLVQKEAPRGAVAMALFLAVVTLVMIRPAKHALLILGHLLAIMILLSGALYLFKIPLNVLNIAVIPIVLGTGIDCFVHFILRYRETKDLRETLRVEELPIMISNLTSLVGFGGLIFTSSQGIRSAGWVAVIGLSLVALVCSFVFPRSLSLVERRSA